MPPSPTKCLAQATTESGSARSAPWNPRTAAAPRSFTMRGLRVAFVGAAPALVLGTVTQGAKTQLMPVARTSSAVMRSICSTSAASRVQPRPMLCGKMHRAGDVVVPVHGVHAVEQRDGQAGLRGRASGSRRPCRSSRAGCNRPCSSGPEPPPLRSEPRKYFSMSAGSFRAPWSGWHICPIFSSRVIARAVPWPGRRRR